MKTKIYTKSGDQGETSLFGGKRVSKDDLRIEAYGTVDELNANLGYLSDLIEETSFKAFLFKIQNQLFNIGALLAVDPAQDFKMPGIDENDVKMIEEEIDKMEEELTPLKNFILPAGNPIISHCHIVRCVCRRAERRVISLSKREEVEELIIHFLNRLSDYLFVLSRWLGQHLGVEEVKWQP